MTNKKLIGQLEFIREYECKTDAEKKAINKTIKILEQQPSEDCISRQAVIRLVEQYPNIIGNRCSGLIADIKHLPSVIPQQRWIPVSERLPNKSEYGKVLVTYVPDGGVLWSTIMIAHYSDLMEISKPCFHIGNVGKSDFENITKYVVAWMPLPEPYKENKG